MVSASAPFHSRKRKKSLVSILNKILKKSLKKKSLRKELFPFQTILKKSLKKEFNSQKNLEKQIKKSREKNNNKLLWYNDPEFYNSLNDVMNDDSSGDFFENPTPLSAVPVTVTVDVDPLVNDTLSAIQIVNTVEIDPLVNDTLSDIQINNIVGVDPLVNDTLSDIQINNIVGVDPLVNDILSEIKIENVVNIDPLINNTLSDIQITNTVSVNPLVNETLSDIQIANTVGIDPLVNETLSQIKIENIVEVDALVNDTLSDVKIENAVGIEPLVNDMLSDVKIENAVGVEPLVNDTLSEVKIENAVGVEPLVNDTLSDVKTDNTVGVDPLVNDTLSEVKIENTVGVEPLVNDTLSDVKIENSVGVDPLVNNTLSDVKIENAVGVDPLVNNTLSDVKIENIVGVNPLVNDTLSEVKIESVVGIEPLVNDITSEIKPSVLETTSQITQKTAINPDSGLFYKDKLIKEINSDYFCVLKNDDTEKFSILIKRINNYYGCFEIDNVITDLESNYGQYVLVVDFDEELLDKTGQFYSYVDYDFKLNILIILKLYLDNNVKFQKRKQEILESYSTITRNKKKVFDFTIITQRNDNLFKEKSFIVNNLLSGSLLDNRTDIFLNAVDKLYKSLYEIMNDEFLQNQLLDSNFDINIITVSNQSHLNIVKEKFPTVVFDAEIRDAKLPCLQFTNRFDLDKLIQEIQKREKERQAEAARLERLKREAAAETERLKREAAAETERLKREAAAETERLKTEAAAAETARLKTEAAVEADRLKKKAEAKEARLQSEKYMKQDMLNDGDFKEAKVAAKGLIPGSVPGTFAIPPIDLQKYISDTTHWNTAVDDQIVFFMRWKLEPFKLSEVDIIFKVFIGDTQIMRYKMNKEEKIKASENNTPQLTDYNTVEITYDMIKDRTNKNLKIIFMNDGLQFEKKIYYKYTEPSWRGKEKTKIDNSVITRDEIVNENLDQLFNEL